MHNLNNIDDELQNFYREKGFGNTIGKRIRFVKVYTGCLLVPFPNIETRNRYLKFHDLHHIITGYSVGRIGEGEMSAWELGSGSMHRNPLIGVMNLIAISTGWLLDRRKIWEAFCSGNRSKNLYSREIRMSIENGQWSSIEEISDQVLEYNPTKKINFLKRLEYGFYIAISLFIHFTVAIPAVVLRYFSDVKSGHGLIGSLKPEIRKDIY